MKGKRNPKHAKMPWPAAALLRQHSEKQSRKQKLCLTAIAAFQKAQQLFTSISFRMYDLTAGPLLLLISQRGPEVEISSTEERHTKYCFCIPLGFSVMINPNFLHDTSDREARRDTLKTMKVGKT